MKTNYQKYIEFCKRGVNMEQTEFFAGIQALFNCASGTAADIWYAEQRSWFEPEMIDELLRLDKLPPGQEFRPNLCSGEFKWVNGKFLPD